MQDIKLSKLKKRRIEQCLFLGFHIWGISAFICISLCLLPACLSVRSTLTCIFLQLLWLFKQSVYLFRECLAVPLVYVLGNTIWPQVLSVYLKPSVSVPLLIVSRVSSRLAPPLIIRAMWKRQCLERREGDLEKDSKKWREREKRAKNKSEQERKRQRELMSDWKRENVDCLWTWPQLLVLLMNGWGWGWGGPRQDCLCCACAIERVRAQQIYVLQEVS